MQVSAGARGSSSGAAPAPIWAAAADSSRSSKTAVGSRKVAATPPGLYPAVRPRHNSLAVPGLMEAFLDSQDHLETFDTDIRRRSAV